MVIDPLVVGDWRSLMSSFKIFNPRLGRWPRRLSVAAWGVVSVWLAVEVLLRVLFPSLPATVQDPIAGVRIVPWEQRTLAPAPPFLPDIDYQSILPPGLKNQPVYFSAGSFAITTINLWGSRVGLRSDAPDWPVDVVVVGDSFSMCYTQFSDCWVKQLNTEHGWRVVNLGERGTGSRAHLQMLTTFGASLKPRIVVWQWYGNDFNEDYGFALLRGEAVPPDAPPESAASPDFGWLADYSAVYAYVRGILWQRDNPALSAWTTYNRYAFNMDRPSNQIGWEMSVQALKQAQEIVNKQIGGKMVILLMPTKEEIQPELVEAAKDAAYVAMLAEGRQRMLRLCQEQGWYCLDASEALRSQAQAGKTVYYATDPHINALGNQVVADAVDEYLTTQMRILKPAK